MSFILIIFLTLLLGQYDCTNTTKPQRQQSAESFNINVSAGYGVQTDNNGTQIPNTQILLQNQNYQPAHAQEQYYFPSATSENYQQVQEQVMQYYMPISGPENSIEVPVNNEPVYNNYPQENFDARQSLQYGNIPLPQGDKDTSYQVHESTHDIEPKNFNVRPNLKELQNVVAKLEAGKAKHSTIVQVLKVPAVYEIHLQSPATNVGSHFINFQANGVGGYPQDFGGYNNHISNAHQGFDSHYNPQPKKNFAAIETHNVENHNGALLEPIIKHHFTQSQNLVNSWNNKPYYNEYQQNYFNLNNLNAIPKESTQNNNKNYLPVAQTKPRGYPPRRSPHFKRKVIPNYNRPITQIIPMNKKQVVQRSEYLEDYKKPQALHEVPAPVLSGEAPRPTFENLQVSSGYSQAIPPQPQQENFIMEQPQPQMNDQSQGYYYNPPIQNFDSTKSFDFTSNTLEDNKSNQNLVYGKQIETVNAPPVYEHSSTSSAMAAPNQWMENQVFPNDNLQQYLDVNLPSTSHTANLQNLQNIIVYPPQPPQSQDNPTINMFYAQQPNEENHQQQDNVYVENQSVNNLNAQSPVVFGDKVPEKNQGLKYGPPPGGPVMQPRPFSKQTQRRSDKMNYVIYITEKTFD